MVDDLFTGSETLFTDSNHKFLFGPCAYLCTIKINIDF